MTLMSVAEGEIMKSINLIATMICVFVMLVNCNNMNILVLNGFLSIINALLYLGE